MERGFRIIVETYDINSNITDSREEIKNIPLSTPQHIKEVGLLHLEQIDILQKILDILLCNQSALIDETGTCLECGSIARKAGKTTSEKTRPTGATVRSIPSLHILWKLYSEYVVLIFLSTIVERILVSRKVGKHSSRYSFK